MSDRRRDRQLVDQPQVRAEPSATIITAELKTLRKGRALHHGRLDRRLGPTLRALCDIQPEDTTLQMRHKVTERLATLAGALPDDLRIPTLVALGIHPDARHRLYHERVGWLANHLGKDERTARRRIDEALERLAELLPSANGPRAASQPDGPVPVRPTTSGARAAPSGARGSGAENQTLAGSQTTDVADVWATDGVIARAVGDELRRARHSAGWTRGQLSDRMPTDIHTRTLAAYEHGERQCPVVRMMEICLTLGVAPSDLLALALQRAEFDLRSVDLRVDPQRPSS